MIQLTDLIVTVAQEADDALVRLAKAVEMSGQLYELGDHLIGHFV
ncbi:MAG: Clp protease, partial [Saccharothrix sp.]|nr:Clp protease [Saccharothrix sp.]